MARALARADGPVARSAPFFGLRSLKNIEVGAGDLTVQVGDTGDYSEVEASVYSGDLNASPFGVSKGGLFRSFHQKGPAEYHLHAHVGAGQIRLVP